MKKEKLNKSKLKKTIKLKVASLLNKIHQMDIIKHFSRLFI